MNIHLLGATGSIGTQTLDIIRTYPDKFKLISCSLGRDLSKDKKIIDEFKPLCVSLREEKDIKVFENEYPDVKFCFGDQGLIEVACYNCNEKGILVNAVVGSIGLIPTTEAIKIGRDIALANKETLVVAGDIVMSLVKENNVKLLPIDSEHSAIMQCIGNRRNEVDNIVITASGGSFRDKNREQLAHVTVEMALNHPNWSMGSKITIDSATMMNKGFEVIEAHHLFSLPYEKIYTIMHRESVVHSMVEFVDSAVIAQLGSADMRIPILYALGYTNRLPYNSKLDLLKIKSLNFEELSQERFPCLRLAYAAGIQGGIMPAVLNAANEAAVKLFLDKKISFLDIERIIENKLLQTRNIEKPTLSQIIDVDIRIKNEVFNEYGGKE